MPAVPVGDADTGHVRSIIDEEGTVRLSELADQLGTTTTTLHAPIMELVEDGKAAVFPIGDVVEVRAES
jgi:predicted ArsR family transcriptional regulator